MFEKRSQALFAGCVFATTTVIYMAAYYGAYLLITGLYVPYELFIIMPMLFLLGFGAVFAWIGFVTSKKSYAIIGNLLCFVGSFLLLPVNPLLIAYTIVLEIVGCIELNKCEPVPDLITEDSQMEIKPKETKKKTKKAKTK